MTKAEAGDHRGWWQERPPLGTTLQQLLELQQAQQEQDQQRKYQQQTTSLSHNSSDQSTDRSHKQAFYRVSAADARHVSQAAVRSVPAFANNAGSKNALLSNRNHTEILIHSSNGSSDSSNTSPSVGSVHSSGLSRWVLAEVGLSAQKQLASNSSTTTVNATSGPSGKSTDRAPAGSAAGAAEGEPVPVVSAAVTLQQQQQQEGPGIVKLSDVVADGSADVADEGRVTKDQDPGLAVDAAAIANPGAVSPSCIGMCICRTLYSLVCRS